MGEISSRGQWDIKKMIDQCPGLCLSSEINCDLAGLMICSKRLSLEEIQEEKEAVNEGIWFLEIL